MENPDVGITDTIRRNPGAALDQAVPALGSMLVPAGAAGAAGKVATAARLAKGARTVDEAAQAARVAEQARRAAATAANVAQNAAGSYASVRDQGGSQQDALRAAAITVPATLAAGKAGSRGHYLPSGPLAEAAAVNAFKSHGLKVPDSVYKEKTYDFKSKMGAKK